MNYLRKDKLLSDLKEITDWIYKNTALHDKYKELLIKRYAYMVEKIQTKYVIFGRINAFTKIFTSIASLVTTSLLSFNGTFSGMDVNTSATLWWITWSSSLAISVSNVFSNYYKVETKHLIYNKVYYRLKQEIWHYLSLTGPYASTDDHKSTHDNQFRFLMAQLEKNMELVNETLAGIEEEKSAPKNLPRTSSTENMKFEPVTMIRNVHEENYESPNEEV
jgi:hypothetical protein